jgi:hypothetical protein
VEDGVDVVKECRSMGRVLGLANKQQTNNKREQTRAERKSRHRAHCSRGANQSDPYKTGARATNNCSGGNASRDRRSRAIERNPRRNPSCDRYMVVLFSMAYTVLQRVSYLEATQQLQVTPLDQQPKSLLDTSRNPTTSPARCRIGHQPNERE